MGLFGKIDKDEVAGKMFSVVDTMEEIYNDCINLDIEGNETLQGEILGWLKKEIPKFSQQLNKIAMLLYHEPEPSPMATIKKMEITA